MSSSLLDLTLYLVVGGMEEQELFAKVKAALEGGVTLIQLREKNLPAREIVRLGRRLKEFLKGRVPLIVNDRVDIAHAIEAEGVHLGQSDLSVAEARAILGSKAYVGLSVERLEEVEQARDLPVDYLAASPVFATQSKVDCAPPWGLEGLRALCAKSPHPIVAIGGIDPSNAAEVFAAGASGIAVISAICNAPCPQSAARLLRGLCKK